MKVELIEKPRPPQPPPEKELVLRLSEEEARLLRTVLMYFQTTALPDGGAGYAYEVNARRKLRKLFSDELSGRLLGLGIDMVYGLNTPED